MTGRTVQVRIGRTVLRVERLESREVPAAMTPAQIRQAYGFDRISYVSPTGQPIVADGSGQTIAIVDAYDDPNVIADTDVFDQAYSVNGGSQTLYQQYGAASTFLTVHKMSASIQASASWSGEIALDVEWAHAIAPGARILLVEATSSSTTALLAAVDYARSQAGVVAVSMSWGGSEFSSETSTSTESHFTTPAGHLGGSDGLGGAYLPGNVTFVAASGDNGAPAIWPAISPHVLAVGGTTLTITGSGTWSSETGWSGSGGGASTYFTTKPTYQTAYAGTARAAPDVAYDANPSSGFRVYQSYGVSSSQRWQTIGGTSAGSPQWAALVALADQKRAVYGLGSLDGYGQTLPQVYRMPTSYFHDITSGNNGNAASAGYDLVTGLGSPRADLVVGWLAGIAEKAVPPLSSATTRGGKEVDDPLAQPFAVATGATIGWVEDSSEAHTAIDVSVRELPIPLAAWSLQVDDDASRLADQPLDAGETVRIHDAGDWLIDAASSNT
ncbi:MAG: S53 family peptidase [Gemmataceae bacterium]